MALLSLLRKRKPAQPSGQNAPGPWTVYDTDSETPLHVFIACHVHGNLQALAKTGEPPKEMLESAWLALYSEHCRKAGGNQVLTMLARVKNVGAQACKLARVETLLHLAGIIRDKDICSELQQDGYALDYAATDEQYARQIAAASSRFKTAMLSLEQQRGETSGESKAAVTDDYYTELLVNLSDHAKVHLDDTMMLSEFSIRVRRLHDYIATINKQTQQHGRRTH